MSKALLWLIDGGFKVIEPEQAVTIWAVLNGEVEPTEEQAAFLPKVRDVFIPPSYQNQAEGYIQAHRHAKPSGIVPNTFNPETAVTDSHNTPDDNELTHPGISQGSMQGLPVNDR